MESELKNAEKEADRLFETDDKHMRFFDNCKAYLDLVEENEASNEQVNLFSKGPEMNRLSLFVIFLRDIVSSFII